MKKSNYGIITRLIALLTATVLILLAFTACSSGNDGKDGLTPYIGANGNWWVGETDTGVSATGATGATGDAGSNGLTPYIGTNGNWWIGDVDTGVSAAGKNGDDGTPGTNGLTPYIGENGNWWVGNDDTGVKATGANGNDGLTPSVGPNGNWWIGEEDTGIKAEGKDGEDGLTPSVGPNGNWWIGEEDTGVKAEGKDGEDGKPGQDGLTPYIGENGNWWIGEEDTGIFAGEALPPEEDADVLTISKMASHSTGHTISPKENIIYSIAVSNSGRRSKTVTVYDSVPANTTYVEGADANEAGALSWNITVPSGKSVVVSYTVKVNNDMTLCDGGIVPATVASVSTLVATTNDVYIERTFNSYDAQYADLAIDAMIGSEYFEDNVLAKHIYTVICSQNPISAITGESLSATLTAIMNGTAEAEVLDLVAPTLYGGKGHTGAISGVKGLPAESVSARDLVSGDIILTKNGSTYESYIYSNNGVFALKQSDEDVDKGEFLSSLVDMDLYAVIRPSTLLTNYTPTDLDEERDVLTEKQQIIVATAKYYLLRGDWLQYDDSYFCNNNTEIGNESRWQYATHAPEEYTEDMTGYINCAAFTHDIYWTVFGEKLPGGMYTTANYATNASKNNMLVYSFTRTAGQSHTEAEMEKVSKEFLSCLQPGDTLVIRRGTSSGHAMLYIGNGAFIHSSGSSYNYGGSYGVETYEPTIRFHKVNDYFLNATSTNGYIFGTKVTGLYVVRPLQNTTWANKSVTEASLNRYENMQGIVAQKLSSIKENVTVNPGDEITYTLSIYNTNNYAVTLDVTDVVPANTVFVSSDENAVVSGNSLAWVVSIAPRETVELSFTVKVSGYAAYGAEISSGGAMIGGVPFATYDTLVKSTLYEDEQQSLIDAYEQLKSEGTTLRGLALANEIYYRALGINNIFGNTDVAYVMEDETEGVFTPEGLGLLGNGKQAHQRNNGSRYEELLVNSIYGGRGLASTPNEGIRTRLAKEEHLIVGDIYIGRTSSAYVVYMYLGGDTFISLTTMKADTVDISGRLERGPAYSYYYAVLRPSYYFE